MECSCWAPDSRIQVGANIYCRTFWCSAPLVDRAGAVTALEPQGEDVWFSWSDYDGESTGLGRARLSRVHCESLVPAYTSDLMATPVRGTVTAITSFEDKRFFAIDGVGLYRETDDAVVSGQYNSGLIRYLTPRNKRFVAANIKHESMPTGASIELNLIDENDVDVPVIVSNTGLGDVQTRTIGLDPGESVQVKIVVNRGTIATERPILRRWSVLAIAQPFKTENIILPLRLATEVVDDEIAANLASVNNELVYLRGLRDSSEIVTVLIGAETMQAIIKGVGANRGELYKWSGDIASDVAPGGTYDVVVRPVNVPALGAAATTPLFPVLSGGDMIIVQDEGATISEDATTLNLVGAGVDAAAQDNVVTLTIPGSPPPVVIPGGGGDLPDGSAAENSLRWNEDASSWESYSAVSTYYWALTPTVDMQPIADVMIDALTNGFNRSIRGSRPTHYESSVGEVVLSSPLLPIYNINGAAGASWEADAAKGRVASIAALAVFNIETVYSWIILAGDVNGDTLANRYWNIVPRTGTSSEPAGVIANMPEFSQVNKDLIINGVTFLAARARIEWEAGTTIHNFGLTFNPQQDAPTAVWQTPS